MISRKVFPLEDREQETLNEDNVVEKLNLAIKALTLCEHELAQLADEYAKTHLYKAENPFIPQYLGFEETLDDSENNYLHIYTKDDYNLAKKPNGKWAVLVPGAEKYIEATLDNEYMAILFLQVIGMDVVFENIKPEGGKSLDEEIEDILAEAREEKKAEDEANNIEAVDFEEVNNEEE